MITDIRRWLDYSHSPKLLFSQTSEVILKRHSVRQDSKVGLKVSTVCACVCGCVCMCVGMCSCSCCMLRTKIIILLAK